MGIDEYLRILRRRWRWIAGSTAIAAALASLAVFAVEPQFESTTRVMVTAPPTVTVLDEGEQGTAIRSERLQTYSTVIESHVLAQRVIDTLGLSQSPVDLASTVTARVIGDAPFIDISAVSVSASEAQRIAQAYTDEFLRLIPEIDMQDPGDVAVTATVLNKAQLPGSPRSSQPERTMGLGIVAGFLAGIGIAALRESVDGTVRTPAELERLSAAPVRAVIPSAEHAADNPLLIATQPQTPQSEAFRTLRTNLHTVVRGPDATVLVVTSCLPSEGKSSTAVNLALAMAESGAQVLLLEGDLRRPRVATSLDLPDDVGLTDLVSGSIAVDQATQRYGGNGLSVIAGGSPAPSPSELLQSRPMEELLTSLRGLADVIIINSPPLLPVADAAILSTYADGVLLVARYGHTKAKHLGQALSNLEQVGGRLAGTVLTMAPTTGPDAYNYGHGYTP